MKFTYDYPRPMVTVDIFLLRFHQKKIETLLVKRDHPPFEGKWALPGGFIEMQEKMHKSAERELYEETGLREIKLIPILIKGDPDRDPRGRTISIVYSGILAPPFQETRAGDDAREVKWFSLADLPKLSFDHYYIIKECQEKVKFKALWQLWILCFLPRIFSNQDVKIISMELLNSSDFNKRMLEVAKRLSFLKEESNGQFRKKENFNRLLCLTFNELTEAWIKILDN